MKNLTQRHGGTKDTEEGKVRGIHGLTRRNKDWEIRKLGEVCIVERGSSPRPIEKYLTNTSEGVNWIKIGDTKGVDKYICSTKEKITKDGAEKSRYVKEGDFILSNSMSFGRPYIMKTDGYIHDGWFVFRLPNYIDIDYFYYLLISPSVQEQIQSLGAGAIVKNISSDLVKKVIVTYPKSLHEQKRIVAILDECFSAIDKAKANAEKNLKNARELFESYLQGVFENGSWKKIKLSDITLDITDGDHLPPPKSESGLPFITISNINKATHEIDFSDTFKVPQQYYNNLKPNRKPVKGDVLYTVTGSYGIPVLIKDDFAFCFQRHIGLIRPSAKLNSKLLFYWILSPQAVMQANKTATGTAQKTVSLTSLRNFEFPNIPLQEQKTIVRQLDVLRAETKKLEAVHNKKIADLEELKKSMLEKAFNGELKIRKGEM